MIHNKTRIVWPLLALSGTALTLTTAGVWAQTQTSATALPQPPRIAEDAGPRPLDDRPAPPMGERRNFRAGNGPNGPGPVEAGRGPEGPGPDGAGPDGPGHDGPGHDGPGPDGPGRGPKHGPGHGPGPDGPRPAPLDANTAEGSAHSLERAYRTAGEVGTVDGEAREIFNQAKVLYAQSLTAYNAKNYEKAFQLAEGSERLSRTARAIDDAGDKPLPPVAGWTPPPVVKKQAADSDRSAHELNRAFHEASRATEFDNPVSKQLSARAEANYRTALTAYNAKRYDEAAQRARLGAEQGKAAREYAESVKS